MNYYHHKNYDFTVENIDEEGVFSGYGSVFDVVDTQGDLIKYGAFTDTIIENDYGKNIKLLWQHNQQEPIGRFDIIREDNYGLYVEGKIITDIQKGFEAYSLLKSGAISGFSIGYNVVDYEIDELTGNRIIYKLDLYEISLVTFPANKSAQVTNIKGDISGKAIISSLLASVDRLSKCFDV